MSFFALRSSLSVLAPVGGRWISTLNNRLHQLAPWPLQRLQTPFQPTQRVSLFAPRPNATAFARPFAQPSISTILGTSKTQPLRSIPKRPSQLPPTEPKVIFECHRPNLFRALTGLAVLQCGMWAFMAQTSFIINPDGPLWRPVLFAATGVLFVSAVHVFGRFYLGRITILPYGQMTLSTHTMFGGLRTRTLSASSVIPGSIELTEKGLIRSRSFHRLRLAGDSSAYVVDVTKGTILDKDKLVTMLS